MKSTKVIIIGGATASGKTSLSLELARKYNGEIISADSRQVYIGMDIGTAKVAPRPEIPASTKDLYLQPFDYKGIPHYLIDVVFPNQRYTLFDFKNQAYTLIADIKSRGKTPIIVGGTGLYLDAIMKNYQLSADVESQNPEIKTELEKKYQSYLAQFGEDEAKKRMYQILEQEDPDSAATIPPNNIYFVLRALEFTLSNPGESKFKSAQTAIPPFEYELILTDIPREELYKRIEDRIDEQVQQGLIEETQTLINQYGLNLPALTSLGYKEIASYLAKETTLEDALKLFKQKTRNYAKRQLTWFRRYKSKVD